MSILPPPELIAIGSFFIGGGISMSMYSDPQIDNKKLRGEILFWICIVGIITYLLQLFQVKIVEVGLAVNFWRYVDYLFTIPFVQLYVAFSSGAKWELARKPFYSTIVTIVFAILFELLSGLFLYQLLSLAGMFIALFVQFYSQFFVMTKEARKVSIHQELLFYRLLGHVTFLLLFFAIPWLLSPAVLGYISEFTTETLYVYIDVAIKFVLIFLIWITRFALRH